MSYADSTMLVAMGLLFPALAFLFVYVLAAMSFDSLASVFLFGGLVFVGFAFFLACVAIFEKVIGI